MRILMFSNTYKPTISGVVTSISMFRQGLRTAGHEVYLIAPEYANYEDDEPYIFRFPAIDMPVQFDWSVPLAPKIAMEPTVRGIRPEIIHAHHPVVMGGMANSFAQDLQIPLVFTFHSRYDQYVQQYVPIVSELAGWVTDEIITRYIEQCTHVIAPTSSIRAFILSRYTQNTPVSVVPTPVDLHQYHHLEPQRVRSALGLEDAEVLLYVGRLAEEKNLDFILRAFVHIAAQRPHSRLLLVGKGPYESGLKRLAEKLDIARQVIFTGPIPHTEVPHYAAAADLFVFSSHTDTQGLVLIESMAAGTPIVALKAPGPVDVLAEGGGLLVDSEGNEDNEWCFADAVLALLEDRPRLEAMQQEAIRVAQRFSIPATTARLIQVYETAIQQQAEHTSKASTKSVSNAAGHGSDRREEMRQQFRFLSTKLTQALKIGGESEWGDTRLQALRLQLQSMLQEIDDALSKTPTRQ